MQTCVASGQCATRGPKWNRCAVHVGMAACEACIYVCAWSTEPHVSHTRHKRYIHRAGRLIKRTITHMREGLSAWFITVYTPVSE
jgi:hypothetical protein